jgi:hypothetical protein
MARESQRACAPSLRATVSSPAPVARATWAVVPYWRKLNVARTASAVAAAPRAASCERPRCPTIAVSTRMYSGAERGKREPEDLAVVRRAEAAHYAVVLRTTRAPLD